jgi:RNA polymerase sigma factor FliA
MINKYGNRNDMKKRSAFTAKEREDLIVKYAPLVKRIAARMSVRLPSNVLFDELVSAGCVGLIDAVDKYDPSKDVNIKTYAEYRIKGAILDELRSMDWYSRSMRKKIQDISKAVQAVEAREGRPAEDKEIAAELSVPLENYYNELSKIHRVALLSMDEYIKDDDNDSTSKKSFQESVRSEDSPEKNLDRQELKKCIAEAVRKLSKKEQMVVSLYYYDELTLKEIGKVLELTESRICQIHSSALIKLKTRMQTYLDE